jgi:superfamily II DNA or RNA helicase
MLIKTIRFAHDITDIEDNEIDVFVESQDGYTYTIVVVRTKNLLRKMDEEKSNFLQPGALIIIVRELTKEIITEAIEVYAKDDAYWLKLHQFSDDIDISVFDKLQAEHLEYLEDVDELDNF